MATLRLFASIKESAGNCGKFDLEAKTVGELLDLATKKLGEDSSKDFSKDFNEQIHICRIWLNGEPAELTTAINSTDEVALLPPVSGG